MDNLVETVRLLIVSRESAVLRPLWAIAESHSWHVESAVSAWDAMERVQSVAPHVLVLDLPRGDGDGLHILRWLRRLRPDLPVVVLCFPEDAGRKMEATRLGAQDVLIRPFDQSRLEAVICEHLVSPENNVDMASEDIEQLGPGAFFVSAGPVTQKLRAQAELLAEADVPVLILGENGSGKDTLARLIHKLSVRSEFRFLKVNCANMPSELLEAELFGNGRNGAASVLNGQGRFERAERGTLFLDEIAEMPLALQARLMQLLQEKQLRHAGNEQSASRDVRVLASTGANIERALAEGRLREDLYYRLSAFTVQVPPLRQRRGEIAFLLRHLMHKLSRRYSLPAREFSLAALDACQRHSWPGNLRELEAFVKRYLVGGENELSFGEFEAPLGDEAGMKHPSGAGKAPMRRDGDGEEPALPKSLKSLIQTVKCEAERNAIASALGKTGWNRKAAARLLQVSYRTLLYKIEEYEMSVPEPYLSPLPRDRYALQGSTLQDSTGKGNGNGNGKAS